MEIKFHKSVFCMTEKVNDLFMEEMSHKIGYTNEDSLKNLYTSKLEATMFSKLNEIQMTTIYKKPQSLIDWILRRPQRIDILVSCREVLKNPKTLPDNVSTLIYEIKPL